MADTQTSKKRKRTKLKCLVPGCQSVFDEDYRKRHNEKFHGQLLNANKSIPYEIEGAPASKSFFGDSVRATRSEINPNSTNALHQVTDYISPGGGMIIPFIGFVGCFDFELD